MRNVAVISLLLAACGADEQCRGQLEELEYTALFAGGDSAQSLMTALGGELVGTIAWQQPSEFVAVHPTPGEAGLTLTLTHDGGPVQLLRHDTSGGQPNERLACPSDRLVIDAKMSLQSDDGALLGDWDVAVVHEVGAGRTAELVPLEFVADNQGDFSSALVQPKAWEPGTEEVTWTGTLTSAGASGSIQFAATSFDPALGEHSEALATWSVARP